MSTTHARLLLQWQTEVLNITQVRESYFPHLKTDKSLLALINRGKVKLRTRKFTDSRLEKPKVFLQDLAEYLDAQAEQAA